MDTTTARPITYVIPCGGEKGDTAAPARELYTGQMFRHTLANALRSAELDRQAGREARVLILSARYGLVELDEVLEPYDLRMGARGSVTAEKLAEQAAALGIDFGDEVYGLLPRPYLARLDAALRTLDVFVQDVYEACGGIGEQRAVNCHAAIEVPAAGEGDAPATFDGRIPADCATPEGRRAWLAQQSDETLAELQRYMADLIDKGIEVDDDALDDLGVEVRRRRAANPPAPVRAPEHPNMAKIREKVAAQSTPLLLTSHRIARRQIKGATGDDRQAIALVLTTIEAELMRRDVEPPSRLS